MNTLLRPKCADCKVVQEYTEDYQASVCREEIIMDRSYPIITIQVSYDSFLHTLILPCEKCEAEIKGSMKCVETK